MHSTFRSAIPALALLAAFLLSACATTSPHAGAPVRVEQVVYLLQPLDSVTVQAPDGTTQSLIVANTGAVTLPDGQTLPLVGKTTADARTLVEQKWKGAKVAKFVQFHGDRISVLGEVQRPANLPIADTPMTLMDAIAAAGGYTSLANTRSVTVLRQNADQVQIFQIDAGAIGKGKNIEQNIFLESGDIITVPRSFL